jgi:hypothetical protein
MDWVNYETAGLWRDVLRESADYIREVFPEAEIRKAGWDSPEITAVWTDDVRDNEVTIRLQGASLPLTVSIVWNEEGEAEFELHNLATLTDQLEEPLSTLATHAYAH